MTETRLRKRTQVSKKDEEKKAVNKSKGKGRQLVHYHELAEWQRDNHFIHSHYVPETNSYTHSFKSLSYVHNETGNIYSHLIPSVLALVLLSTPSYILSLYSTTSSSDYAAFATFLSGCAICLGLSATFHTLKSHSERVASFGNKLDYLGIVVLIDASMISIVYYGLYGHPELRKLFWGITNLFGVVCAVVSLYDTFRTPDWRTFRASMFVAYGLSGVLPVIGGVMVMGATEAANRVQFKWIALEGVLYIVGAALYACRMPERYSPGRFDNWGHSHQIFHLLVVAAAVSHGKALIEAYRYIHETVLVVS